MRQRVCGNCRRSIPREAAVCPGCGMIFDDLLQAEADIAPVNGRGCRIAGMVIALAGVVLAALVQWKFAGLLAPGVAAYLYGRWQDGSN